MPKYVAEFDIPDVKRCDECRFYVAANCDCEEDRCVLADYPLTDDADCRQDYCPLKADVVTWQRNALTKLDEKKHYKFIPVYPDEYGCCLRHGTDDEEPEDGAWNWWMDKDGNVEYARFKFDGMDHFFPSTKYLNIPHGKTDVECLAGYFKEVPNEDEADR